MPSIDYERLRSTLRIMDVLARIGWQATEGRGAQLRGPCPFCAGVENQGLSATARQPTPKLAAKQRPHRTFSVHTGRNIYRCFRCGASGNAIDLWAAYRRLPIYEASKELTVEPQDPAIKQPENEDSLTNNSATIS